MLNVIHHNFKGAQFFIFSKHNPQPSKYIDKNKGYYAPKVAVQAKTIIKFDNFENGMTATSPKAI